MNRIPVFIVTWLPGNFNAVTWPPFGIFIHQSQRNNKELIEHEKIHWRQYERMGLFRFINEYQRQIKVYGYDAAPMEIEARANESEYCKRNYTKCVRSGLANTVFNPSFRK